METAAEFFPGSEGIDVYDGMLFFVTKKKNLMYTLYLDSNTWERRSTKHGAFDGSPDQLARMVGEEEILYYTEVSHSFAYHYKSVYFRSISLLSLEPFFLYFNNCRRVEGMLAFTPAMPRADSSLFLNRQFTKMKVLD